jgi:sulfur carrier protein ThiS adenylyltransferase
MKFPEIKSHLSKFKVGIAGAGGLGSNCAVALARSGVGTLVISDFDIVEWTNLNRQYYFTDQVGMQKTDALRDNIARINPETIVITHNIVLDASNIPVVFEGCDLVIEAFDRSDMKEILIETMQRIMQGTPIIIGSGVAGWGKSDSVSFRKIDDTMFVCGDESTEVSESMSAMAPKVGMVANMQANVAIEILMNLKG